MTEPADMIVPIQSGLAALRKESAEKFKVLEPGHRNIRSALAGDTVLSRMLVGEYEERIDALARKVEELEARK